MVCYGYEEEGTNDPAAQVRTRDQFGTLQFEVANAVILCVPALKSVVAVRAQAGENPPGVDPEHFQCYHMHDLSPFEPRRVALRDQFGRSVERIVEPEFFCTPVGKNGSAIEDRRTHIVCYAYLNPDNDPAAAVRTRDQFGRLRFRVGLAVLLCAPARAERL